jgi:hypothetical protein
MRRLFPLTYCLVHLPHRTQSNEDLIDSFICGPSLRGTRSRLQLLEVAQAKVICASSVRRPRCCSAPPPRALEPWPRTSGCRVRP